MSPASAMLLQAATRLNGPAWLVLGGEADLVRSLVAEHPSAAVEWQPVDSRERDAVSANHLTIRMAPVESGREPVDVVMLPGPPDRGLARRWLLVARERLADDGMLLLAGANAEGIRSIIADATALFGAPEFEQFGQKQRIAGLRQRRAEGLVTPGWSEMPGIAPSSWAPFRVETGGESLPLATRAGVFAGAQLDAGTSLLLEALPNPVSGSVLDVGCGAGVIGIVAAKRGAASVVMSDANLLAVATTQKNVHDLRLSQCEVVAGDVYSGIPGLKFDVIVSNPPFHRGKSVDLSVTDRLIAEAPEHLNDGGQLLVVANAFLAYGKRMERVFRSVDTVAATRQFHVLTASDPR